MWKFTGRALSSRWLLFCVLPLLILAWLAFSIPGGLEDTMLRLQFWAQAALATGATYVIARSITGKVRGETMANEALERGNIGAGLVFLGIQFLRAFIFLGLLLFFSGAARAAGVPPNALKHLPTLKAQQVAVWPDMHRPEYLGALVEHESCTTLTSPRCWSPTARLKTAREEGAGLGQLTRAFRADGSLRFDALADARRLDPGGLSGLRWDTVYQRPDLQLRVIVLTQRANVARLLPLARDRDEALAMADAAYNGGLMGVLNERRACAFRSGCNPSQWFGHVERTCLKSAKPLYGTRSACDINRHHVADVWARMPKYTGLLT
ncbi:hypothetical protein [Ideonella livida]|uniref:Uncharacterized protein n=1 Tax=Ideonella livida TaxID=2707176 RepID=A0A7C9PEU7_9BURK|nr:hypothetical protein [Ideonella livida]NDY89690.1 hypothetical protein [Ideonella livida]